MNTNEDRKAESAVTIGALLDALESIAPTFAESLSDYERASTVGFIQTPTSLLLVISSASEGAL